jgi:hypothetical protein
MREKHKNKDRISNAVADLKPITSLRLNQLTWYVNLDFLIFLCVMGEFLNCLRLITHVSIVCIEIKYFSWLVEFSIQGIFIFFLWYAVCLQREDGADDDNRHIA